MDYELYHDESKEGGYWHGMLLVPVIRKSLLVEYLESARDCIGYHDPLGIKKVKRRGRIFDCASSWVQIGVCSLISQLKGNPPPIYLGEKIRGKKQYSQFRDCIAAKFILFCERDNLTKMAFHRDFGSKVETIFRIGLKGGLHFLAKEDEVIKIDRIHFDGHEHYSRHIDYDRIINRLTSLREYCSISNRSDLIDDRSGNHKKSNCQAYEDCQLIQLTDLLVGCFRTLLGEATKPIHIKLSYPVESIIKRYQQGYSRMMNSRWRNSFCMSQCYLESGRWKYDTFEYNERRDSEQMKLPLE